MQKILFSKLGAILVLMAVFLFAFTFIRAMVYERQASQRQVLTEIANGNVGAQSLFGPLLVVPVTETVICTDKEGNDKPCERSTALVLSPQKSRWDNRLTVSDSAFRRGIYRAITWDNALTVEGSFLMDSRRFPLEANQQAHWDKAQLRFYLSDLRGVKSQPVLAMGGQRLAFAFPDDEGSNRLGTGFTALSVPAEWLQSGREMPFRLDVGLTGMGRVQVIPAGGEMEVSMQADWPHPSFYGASLPDKTIRQDGFSARWQNAYLTSRNNQLLNACFNRLDGDACNNLQAVLNPEAAGQVANAELLPELKGGFAVSFIQPVNVYHMTERALKYALLFLVITFGAFFLFEVLKDLRIHPMQYGLVGGALAVFYLLLLSFSEHAGFRMAYGLSSAACIGLITYYVSHVLQSLARALGFSVVLAGMYGTLFVILQSEDYTLMLGSVLVFLLLAAVMMLTRRVDWYALGQKGG
ncbi:MAG: cell envelope integrity protein CreD [Fluviicoccus sp.]|uniref:cell envelope integrity protein CreD n=1 Tax=Fluviicoccus sp. TaxID=2003552 RepID=UPI00271D885D|nr:cell envelope integrity protein CreD [Fluviicoccus sp.]MDO8329899.1 cell envelope integrity protein CreD [Fluviicoccus sp.]